MRLGRTVTNDKSVEIRKLKKSEGYSLIEVLIAISIFAVGMLAVAAMQTSAIKVNSSAGQISECITWAQDKLEELMALSYSDPRLEVAGNPPGGTDSAGNPHQETSDGYTISWTVIDNSPVSHTKHITVTVTGHGKTVRLVSIKS